MHSNRPYEAGRAKAKQDLGLHPVQPPAPWTQEVDKRLRVRTGSAVEKDPSEKRAYGLKDVIGDALAAGASVAPVAMLDESRKLRYDDDAALRAWHKNDDTRSRGRMAEAGERYVRHRTNMYTALDAAPFAGGVVPVGEHYLATPLMTGLGAQAARSLLRKYGPRGVNTDTAFTHHAVAAAGGALAGRTALRGFDALRERMAKKKEGPQDAEKKSFENADRLPGGPADKKRPSDFDQKQLLKGQQHEMEHTTDPSLAREIASDHLTEHPNYYERLLKAEKNWGK